MKPALTATILKVATLPADEVERLLKAIIPSVGTLALTEAWFKSTQSYAYNGAALYFKRGHFEMKWKL